MLYTIATIAGKEYKLRLGAQDCVDVEKRLGKSVLDVLLAMAPDDLQADGNPESVHNLHGMLTPKVGDICIILHGSMQKYQHGIALNDVYDLYDEHIDGGGSYNDFFEIISKILEVSGFLPKKAEVKNVPPEQSISKENGQKA